MDQQEYASLSNREIILKVQVISAAVNAKSISILLSGNDIDFTSDAMKGLRKDMKKLGRIRKIIEERARDEESSSQSGGGSQARSASPQEEASHAGQIEVSAPRSEDDRQRAERNTIDLTKDDKLDADAEARAAEDREFAELMKDV